MRVSNKRLKRPSKDDTIKKKDEVEEEFGGEFWICERCGSVHHLLDQVCNDCFDDEREDYETY